MTTLRTNIASKDWATARDQLLTCRTWLAGIPDGGEGDKNWRFRSGELDKLDETIKEKLSGNKNRFIHTRTNYATR